MRVNLNEKYKVMFLAYVTWTGGGKKWNNWGWIGATAHCWLARTSTRNHKNTRELWRITISESVFCRQSWLSQLHQLFWLCDEGEIAMPIMLHSVSTTTSLDCDTVTLCYNPQLSHFNTALHSAIPNCDTLSGRITSRRSLWIFLPMWRFWLTRCITFSSRKVKIREQL